jgi:mono/diheme cytochrome c family protein
MTRILPVLSAAGLALASGLARAQAPSTGDARKGFAAFMADGCHQCHGTVAQGGQGPTLARIKLPAEAFEQLVRRPVGSMPAYSPKVLPAPELSDIYAYLQSVAPPPARRPAILDD